MNEPTWETIQDQLYQEYEQNPDVYEYQVAVVVPADHDPDLFLVITQYRIDHQMRRVILS